MRVGTWNLLHGLDVTTGRIDLGAVAAAIDGLDVDVLAVQEVDRGLPRSGGADQVAELARRLGWHGVFAPALLGDPTAGWGTVPEPDPGGPAYGVGMLLRAPPRAVARRTLPGGGAGGRQPGRDGPFPGWDREPRAALRVVTAAGPVVTTTHLSYLPWRGIAQLRTALAFAGTGVLLGDLNLPLRALRPALLGTGWSAHAAEATYPSWKPGVQLDHVVGRGVGLDGVRVAGRGPSDHLPLLVSVR